MDAYQPVAPRGRRYYLGIPSARHFSIYARYAKTRLDDFSEKVRTAKLTKVVDQDIHARFDVVVSINAIHTMEEPSEAISALGEP